MTKRETNGHGSEQLDPVCVKVQDRLPAYVTAEALGQHPPTIDLDVAAHLSGCIACRAAFDELRQLAIDAYSGAITPAPSYPQPDLSFLPARSSAAIGSQPWRIDEWGRLIITFSQSLLDSLRPPALLAAARGQLLYSYAVVPHALPGLEVNIEVFAGERQAGLGFVRVSVESLDRDPFDQVPSRVVARAADATWEGTTDATGCVAFDAVPLAALPSLTIEIAAERSGE
jgi:hypothetical protein